MARFWTRTRSFLVGLWLAVVAAEFIVFFAVERIDNSWVLLLFAAVLALPLIAIDMTVRWVRRPARKRWERYDVAAGAASVRTVVEAPVDPPAEAPPAERTPGLA
ncbi:hypothetical protein [Longimicrobium sp.]|jgi:cytochrome bd-type quinol oxidase subunit 1|uniref:hypothetical protein n=1 Tax=Longimicrobium sp. TaxID=2029185 RepID=UPI002F954458